MILNDLICLPSRTWLGAEHDLARLPFDLRPVRWLIGRWGLTGVSGRAVAIKPPDVLDFGINPIPLFGARAVNIT